MSYGHISSFVDMFMNYGIHQCPTSPYQRMQTAFWLPEKTISIRWTRSTSDRKTSCLIVFLLINVKYEIKPLVYYRLQRLPTGRSWLPPWRRLCCNLARAGLGMEWFQLQCEDSLRLRTHVNFTIVLNNLLFQQVCPSVVFIWPYGNSCVMD